jgi:cardiolipin synthase
MMLRLLVDAAEFRPALAADLELARLNAFLQTLSFEGDAAGTEVASLLAASTAADRRVLVDSFSRHVLSDRFRWHPRNLVSPPVWGEARATRRMIRGLRRQGVPVRFVNPAGPLFWRFPARNHKKLVSIDRRIAYLGGINFSDHNFAWHDLMLRIEDARVAEFLEDDFLATWEGRNRADSLRLPELELHILDGRRNHVPFGEVLDLLARAREEVFLECPYVTDPFSRELERAARRGVRVTVLTSERHNWPLFREGLVRAASRSPLELRLYPDRMTHLKALLVDRRWLVLGSANFDLLSYRWQQEYLALLREPRLIEEFSHRVVWPDIARSARCPGPRKARGWRALEAQLALLSLVTGLGTRAPGGSRAAAPSLAGLDGRGRDLE